eukprot:177015_1
MSQKHTETLTLPKKARLQRLNSVEASLQYHLRTLTGKEKPLLETLPDDEEEYSDIRDEKTDDMPGELPKKLLTPIKGSAELSADTRGSIYTPLKAGDGTAINLGEIGLDVDEDRLSDISCEEDELSLENSSVSRAHTPTLPSVSVRLDEALAACAETDDRLARQEKFNEVVEILDNMDKETRVLYLTTSELSHFVAEAICHRIISSCEAGSESVFEWLFNCCAKGSDRPAAHLFAIQFIPLMVFVFLTRSGRCNPGLIACLVMLYNEQRRTAESTKKLFPKVRIPNIYEKSIYHNPDENDTSSSVQLTADALESHQKTLQGTSHGMKENRIGDEMFPKFSIQLFTHPEKLTIGCLDLGFYYWIQNLHMTHISHLIGKPLTNLRQLGLTGLYPPRRHRILDMS